MMPIFYIVAILLFSSVVQGEFTCLKNEVGETEECRNVTLCFILYNKGKGKKEYGCFESMNFEQSKICAAHEDLCKTCSTDNCNTKDQIKMCVACEGLNCTTKPESLKNSHVQGCGGDCYTSYNEKDGLNKRGCLTNDINCDDPNTCKRCTGDVCNTEIFPPNRRICLTKTGFSVCPNPTDSCMSFLRSSGEPVKLDCKENLLKDEKIKKKCEQNPYLCAECFQNKCNENKKRMKCVKCDESNKSCLDSPEQLEENSFEFCQKECFFEISKGSIRRGCSDNYKCEGNSCVKCASTFCKEKPILTCYKSKNETVDCSSADGECVNIYDHNTGLPVIQGCFEDLEENLRKKCQEDPVRCGKCSRSNCNNWQKAFRCITCNGLDCLKPTESKNKICNIQSCYTTLKNDNTNERGCGECKELNCAVCKTSSCNNQVYPKKRRQCLINDKGESNYCKEVDGECYANVQENGLLVKGCFMNGTSTCNEGSCLKCRNDKCNTWQTCLECDDTTSCSTPSYCLQSNQICFSRILDGEIQKGCKPKGFCDGQTYCNECSGLNCNTKVPEVTGMQCYKCKGEKECAEKQTRLVACNNKDDKCFVMINNRLVERGCKSSSKDSCVEPTCKTCTEKGCNGFALDSASCYDCNHEIIGCGPEINNDLLYPTDCRGFYFPEQNHCFYMKNETTRGCLSPTEEQTCSEAKVCCKGMGCNDKHIANNVLYKRCGWTTWVLSGITILFAFNLSA